jgi:hypothetical protein
MATASRPDYRASGAAYVRNTLTKLHHHGTSVSSQLWAFLLAFPALVQGVYFLLTGLWPLVSIDTFQAVTGPKHDLWLAQTVGVLVLVIGCMLCLAAYRRQTSPEVVLIALGSALALAGVDAFFFSHGRISAPYLLDAAIQLCLVGLWLASWYHEEATPARPVTAPPVSQIPTAPT